MKRHGIPTADYETFTDAEAAHAYVREKGAPIVIKADGLAAGKGVVVAMTEEDAHEAVDFMLQDNKLGSAGARIVIEEYLTGEEASFIVMVDGEHVLPMATSQDHKRLLDADEGPNTGGMGAYSPAPVVTDEVYKLVMDQIILPTVRGMKEDGMVFTGFLYAGLMIDRDSNGKPTVKTLEFNCRFGDPETQPDHVALKERLPRRLLKPASTARSTKSLPSGIRAAHSGVVLASHGYPVSPRKGDVITGIEAPTEDSMTFHAGTKLDENGNLLTSGGRVLCVVGLGDTLRSAKDKAYSAAEKIRFDGMQYRKDIGHRAL